MATFSTWQDAFIHFATQTVDERLNAFVESANRDGVADCFEDYHYGFEYENMDALSDVGMFDLHGSILDSDDSFLSASSLNESVGSAYLDIQTAESPSDNMMDVDKARLEIDQENQKLDGDGDNQS